MEESSQAAQVRIEDDDASWVKAPKVQGLRCHEVTDSTIEIRWDEPWNGAKVTQYSIWVHQLYQEFTTDKLFYKFENLKKGSDYSVWIRATHRYEADPYSPPGDYSERLDCKTLND